MKSSRKSGKSATKKAAKPAKKGAKPAKESWVNENTVLADIMEVPEANNILGKYNFPCLHCPMARYEVATLKLGEVCSVYNIDAKKVIEDLNKLKVKR